MKGKEESPKAFACEISQNCNDAALKKKPSFLKKLGF